MSNFQTRYLAQSLSLPSPSRQYCTIIAPFCAVGQLSRPPRPIHGSRHSPRFTPKRCLFYPPVFTHLRECHSRVERLSTDLTLPITEEETTILKQILPVWVAPGVLIPRLERVLVVRTLQRCTQLVPEGCNRLPALFYLSGMRDHALGLFPLALDDVKWWIKRLSLPLFDQASSHSPYNIPVVDLNVYADASYKVVGVFIGREWLAWKFVESLTTTSPQIVGFIGWAEVVAIELALVALVARGHASCRIPIKSDSTEAIHSLRRGLSKNLNKNLVVRRIVALQHVSQISLKPIHVPSYLNMADNLTNFNLPGDSRRFPHDVPLPQDLQIYLVPL